LLPNPALLARSHPRGSGGKRREAGEHKRRESPKVYAVSIAYTLTRPQYVA
jgi:hypothetical protein